MIVDHAHKFISVSIPKTGSISIQFSLGHGHNIPEPDEYHCGIAQILEKYPECRGYYKFGFVRNPWARLVSLYNDFTMKRGYQYSALERHDKPLLSEFGSFEGLCRGLKDSPWRDNVFFTSQYSKLSIGGSLAVNFVGRYESIQQDYSRVCQHIGVNAPLQQHNVGVYDQQAYRTYYTPETAALIGDLYQDDVKHFEYQY